MICTLGGISRKMNSMTMRGGAVSTKWKMGNSYRIIAVWRGRGHLGYRCI